MSMMDIKDVLTDAYNLAEQHAHDTHVIGAVLIATLTVGSTSGMFKQYANDQFNAPLNKIRITVSKDGWNDSKLPMEKQFEGRPVSTDEILASKNPEKVHNYVQYVINDHETNIKVHPEAAESVAKELNGLKKNDAEAITFGIGNGAIAAFVTLLMSYSRKSTRIMITPFFVPEAIRQRQAKQNPPGPTQDSMA